MSADRRINFFISGTTVFIRRMSWSDIQNDPWKEIGPEILDVTRKNLESARISGPVRLRFFGRLAKLISGGAEGEVPSDIQDNPWK